jgi:hypothetical protein
MYIYVCMYTCDCDHARHLLFPCHVKIPVISQNQIDIHFLSLSLSLSLSGCELPLGTSAQGLMYVDPEGTPLGEFDGTATNIREVFARMGFDDRMTVAAIGGGHAFGK